MFSSVISGCAARKRYQPSSVIAIRSEASGNNSPSHRNYAWARLMMRVFKLDVLKCERCGARLRILAAIHPPDTTTTILDCLGLPSRAPPVVPAVSEASPEYF